MSPPHPSSCPSTIVPGSCYFTYLSATRHGRTPGIAPALASAGLPQDYSTTFPVEILAPAGNVNRERCSASNARPTSIAPAPSSTSGLPDPSFSTTVGPASRPASAARCSVGRRPCRYCASCPTRTTSSCCRKGCGSSVRPRGPGPPRDGATQSTSPSRALLPDPAAAFAQVPPAPQTRCPPDRQAVVGNTAPHASTPPETTAVSVQLLFPAARVPRGRGRRPPVGAAGSGGTIRRRRESGPPADPRGIAGGPSSPWRAAEADPHGALGVAARPSAAVADGTAGLLPPCRLERSPPEALFWAFAAAAAVLFSLSAAVSPARVEGCPPAHFRRCPGSSVDRWVSTVGAARTST